MTSNHNRALPFSYCLLVAAFAIASFASEVAVAQEPEPASTQEDTADTTAPAPVTEGPPPAPVSAPILAVTSASEPANPPRPRKKRKLMIAGLATFGGGYLFTVLVAAAMQEQNNADGQRCVNCDDVIPRLFIPVIGPFLATPYADGTDGKTYTILMGVVQTAGVALTIAGIAMLAKSKREIEEYDANYGVALHSSHRLTVALSPDRLRLTW